MISPENVPYVDPEPLPVLVEECRCVEAECAAHGVDLHPGRQRVRAAVGFTPLLIEETPRYLVEGYPDYGA